MKYVKTFEEFVNENHSVNEEFPGKGEIVKAKDLNYDMLDYFNRMNIKLLINTKSKKNIKGSVGTMFNDLVFNGGDIDKKDIVSVEILESVVNESKKYGIKSNTLNGLIKEIKKLPDTIEYINVPIEFSSFQPSTIKVTPADKDWKNEIIKAVKGAVKGPRGKEIDEFILRSYYGDLGKDTDPFYIQFRSESSRKFADDMRSGKYGRLD